MAPSSIGFHIFFRIRIRRFFFCLKIHSKFVGPTFQVEWPWVTLSHASVVPSSTPSKWSNFGAAFHRHDLDGRGLMNVGRRLKTYPFLRLNFSPFSPEGQWRLRWICLYILVHLYTYMYSHWNDYATNLLLLIYFKKTVLVYSPFGGWRFLAALSGSTYGHFLREFEVILEDW